MGRFEDGESRGALAGHARGEAVEWAELVRVFSASRHGKRRSRFLGADELLNRARANLGFTVTGGAAELRGVIVTTGKRRVDWAATKTRLAPKDRAVGFVGGWRSLLVKSVGLAFSRNARSGAISWTGLAFWRVTMLGHSDSASDLLLTLHPVPRCHRPFVGRHLAVCLLSASHWSGQL